MRDKFSKEKRSQIMSLIRSKGTEIEEKFRKGLCKEKIKGYRINPKTYANPDFSFNKYKIAIFCDGDFWHGKNYSQLKPKLRKKMWREKIERNIKRDSKYNRELKKQGWAVLRFWGSEINKDVNKCVLHLKKSLIKKGYKL